jgi:hypothetical protein
MAERPQSANGRIAVIGDVGGHLRELRAELIRLGADSGTLELPVDLVVVQVGDLVHRGPDSDGVVALVDHYLQEQPEHWVQLAGNHEAQYVREPDFEWPERIGDVAAATMRSWWACGQMSVAVAIRASDEDFLITHAGLTEGFWRDAMDSPAPALDAARVLNSFIGSHESVLFYAGQMLGGGAANFTAGPIWAAAESELIPSWMGGRPMPFSQLHGHSRVFDSRGKSRGSAGVDRVMTADSAAGHEYADLPGGRIIGVDPGHGRTPRRAFSAFVVSGHLLR